MRNPISRLISGLIVMLVAGLGLLFVSHGYAAGDTNVPSDVYIDAGNNMLMVKKPNDSARPFIIKGLSWAPATRAPLDGPNPLNPAEAVQYGFFFDWAGRNPAGYEVLNYWLKNQLLEHYLTDIPLMRQMNVNTVRIYHSIGSSMEDYNLIAQDIRKVLDECYNNGNNSIMVIMTVAMSKSDLDSGKYLSVVNAYKDHPAILMWAIGNEWNFNKLYGYGTLDEAATAVNLAAQKIKAVDAHHPVNSILGDVFISTDCVSCEPVWILKDVIQRCPDIDLWGLNIYRGNSFRDLFLQWKNMWQQELLLPAKPFYVSEFGIDSFYSTSYTLDGTRQVRADNVVGYEDQQKQADVDAGLWGEIKSHLSSSFPSELCLGGLIHEFNDELWKVGSYHTGLGGLVDYSVDHSFDEYNSEGFVLTGASPDNVLNEEYFGLVTADRLPKLAYERMKAEWVDTTAPSTPVVNDTGVYTNNVASLSAGWISSDPESGIVEYQYKITRDSISGTIIKNWTSTGVTPSVTVNGLTLWQGRKYYFSVKVKNGAGLWSAIGYSDGIKVDITASSKPIVNDGGTYTSSTTSLKASWTSSDLESGIAEYQYLISQDSITGTVIKDWTSTGATPSVTVSGLTLLQGKKYYFSVKAKNGVGFWSAIGYSNGIKVDTTAPSKPVVKDGGVYTSSTTALGASCFSSDPESGIREYRYKITQDSTGGVIIKNWTSNGASTLITATGLTLVNGKKYYFSVMAKNGAGLWSVIGYSDGITVISP